MADAGLGSDGRALGGSPRSRSVSTSRNFAGYAGDAYGALGGVLAFIFWLDLMSLILLLGAELNSVLACAVAAAPRPEAVASTATDGDAPESRASVPRGTYTPEAVRVSSSSSRGP